MSIDNERKAFLHAYETGWEDCNNKGLDLMPSIALKHWESYNNTKYCRCKLYGRHIESEGLGGYTYSPEMLLGIFDSKEDAEAMKNKLRGHYDYFTIEEED
jgi:hypothetical protein